MNILKFVYRSLGKNFGIAFGWLYYFFGLQPNERQSLWARPSFCWADFGAQPSKLKLITVT